MDTILPVVFVALMGLAILVYAVLDGYDLGVGILMPNGDAHRADRDRMVASIGPFWDANETWLVLAVGLLLIAFPAAYSQILHHFYLPVTLMLGGLILRGVAFDFRTKASVSFQPLWEHLFKLGSLITALCQGWMLGRYIVAFDQSMLSYGFAVLSSLGVAAAYAYIGACWLIFKTEGDLQRRAVRWARWAGRCSFAGVILVSATNPLVNPGVFARWFDFPLVMFVLLIPFSCFLLFVLNELLLQRMPRAQDRFSWLPFVACIGIFLLCFSGIAFSFFPDIVPGELTVWEAASATESLQFIFYGAVIVVPTILAYTGYAYWVFRGKATKLEYH